MTPTGVVADSRQFDSTLNATINFISGANDAQMHQNMGMMPGREDCGSAGSCWEQVEQVWREKCVEQLDTIALKCALQSHTR